MSGSAELLILRLALTGTILVFVLVAAVTMRSGLRTDEASAPQPRGRRPGVCLVVVAPGATGLVPGSAFAVAGEMTLGRDTSCSILLGDASVSNRHARLEGSREHGWRITDLGSTNGTFVSGQRLDRHGFALRGGELIHVGAVTLRFEA